MAVPKTIDIKRLPPGHAKFQGGNGENSIYLAHGSPYNAKGELLPADAEWLRSHNYVYNEDVGRILREHDTAPKKPVEVKHCAQCSGTMAMSAKFCPECGAPQVLATMWAPNNSSPEDDRLAKLVDPMDTLGSLAALTDTTPAPRRQTPDEIFAALNADTARRAGLSKIAADLSKDPSNKVAGIIGGVNEFGTLTVVKE